MKVERMGKNVYDWRLIDTRWKNGYKWMSKEKSQSIKSSTQ